MQRRLAPALVFLLIPIAQSLAADAADHKHWRVEARWFGSIKYTGEVAPTQEPGAFGAAFNRPHSRENSAATVVIREEVDTRDGSRRDVVENLNWHYDIGELYFQNRDGTRVGAGNGGSGGGGLSESDLAGDPVPVDQKVIDSAQQRVHDAEKRTQDARKQYEENLKAEKQWEQEADQDEKTAYASEQQALNNVQQADSDPSATPQQRKAAQDKYSAAEKAFQDAIYK